MLASNAYGVTGRMAITRIGTCVLALCLLAANSRGQASQLSAPVSYDAFMRLDIQERNRTFKQVTPETRAGLVQTHIQRWIDPNRTRLTSEQLLLMFENLGFVTPDHYRQKASADDLARAKDLAVRTMAVFSPKDLVQALTFNGPPIPINDEGASLVSARSRARLHPTGR
jgi:hypothetical protein